MDRSLRDRLALLAICAAGTVAGGCGGAAGTRESAPPEEMRVARPADALPPAPPGSLFADGFGATLREASLDAKRAVAEQLDARIKSQLEARESEDSLRGGSRDVTQRVRTESAFEHAELIEVRGEAQRSDGYVVRAYLDRDRAAGVYRKDIQAEREKLEALLPVTERAIAAGDAAQLVRSDRAPGFYLDRMARKRRVLSRLEGREPVAGDAEATGADASALALERRASAARREARLRLHVEGEVTAAVRAAAVEQVGRLFAARGCGLTEEAPRDPSATTPMADVLLRLSTRAAREAGVNWRYLGLEVEVKDARSGESFFRFAALPEIAKGGGALHEQADRALLRNLEERLPARATEPFLALTCR